MRARLFDGMLIVNDDEEQLNVFTSYFEWARHLRRAGVPFVLAYEIIFGFPPTRR